MGKRQMTPQEQVTRWEHIREIENLMGKRSFYGIYRWSDKVWDEMWCKKAPDPTLGFNNGYYKGYEAISAYYDAVKSLDILKAELVKAANPKELEGKSIQDILGVGSLDVNNITTPIIELAEDCQTAKGLWYYMRGDTDYDASGPSTYHRWGWLGVDFVYEDGAWKIWHMVSAQDLDYRAGETWLEPTKPLPEVPEYAPIGQFQFPQPNVPMDVYELWHDRRVNADFPGVPQPYDTFANTFSYGI